MLDKTKIAKEKLKVVITDYKQGNKQDASLITVELINEAQLLSPVVPVPDKPEQVNLRVVSNEKNELFLPLFIDEEDAGPAREMELKSVPFEQVLNTMISEDEIIGIVISPYHFNFLMKKVNLSSTPKQ